jgi:hypothetical protein
LKLINYKKRPNHKKHNRQERERKNRWNDILGTSLKRKRQEKKKCKAFHGRRETDKEVTKKTCKPFLLNEGIALPCAQNSLWLCKERGDALLVKASQAKYL